MLWAATLYSASSGQTGVVQCGVRGFYWPDAASFADRVCAIWDGLGELTEHQAALGQDRDFWYDATTFILYVYSAGGESGEPIWRLSRRWLDCAERGDVLNLNGGSWLRFSICRSTGSTAMECRCRD